MKMNLGSYLPPTIVSISIIGASLDFQTLISPFRWCLSEDKNNRDEFVTISNLYNCGFHHTMLLWFATMLSSLWNVLLNRSGSERWWRTWKKCWTTLEVLDVCERVSANSLGFCFFVSISLLSPPGREKKLYRHVQEDLLGLFHTLEIEIGPVVLYC